MGNKNLNSKYFYWKLQKDANCATGLLTFFLITFLTHFRWKIKIAKINPQNGAWIEMQFDHIICCLPGPQINKSSIEITKFRIFFLPHSSTKPDPLTALLYLHHRCGQWCLLDMTNLTNNPKNWVGRCYIKCQILELGWWNQ